MSKKSIIITIVVIIVVALAYYQPWVKTPASLSDQQTPADNQEVDTSDLETYKNEQYEYEIKYPSNWTGEFRTSGIVRQNNYFAIFYDGWREGVPEGGDSLKIEVRNIDLDTFIQEYNNLDVLEDGTMLSKIVAQEDYLLDGRNATKLSGTTAIGLIQNYIFYNDGNVSYIINYADYDPIHEQILLTFKFTD